MMYDQEKVDDVVLALLHLNAFEQGGAVRAWKSFDWNALDRLHERGMISSPKSTAKSVILTEEGARQARRLFKQYFIERTGT